MADTCYTCGASTLPGDAEARDEGRLASDALKAAADMRKRLAGVICPFCNKGVPISGDGRHLGIECLAIEVWTLPLDGGDDG